MTNSEEPSAPDGISSSMKVSSEAHHHHHNNTFGNGNYANGDLTRKVNNGGNGTTSSSCAFPPPLGGAGSGDGSSSSVVTGGSGSLASQSSYTSSSLSSCSSSSPSTSMSNSAPGQSNNITAEQSDQREHTPPPPGDGSYYNLNIAGNSSQQQHQQQPSVQAPSSSSSSSLPFTLICGEVLQHKTEVSDGGSLVLTNYRLFLLTKESSYNLPLGLLESVECRDIFYLHLNCKDARAIRSTFPNNEAALEMLKRIQAAISPTKKVEDNFAFTFYKRTKDVSMVAGEEIRAHLGWDLPPFPTPKERFDAEIKRMEFNVQGPWRISDENKDYELCNSYPTHIIVPCVMDKRKLEQVACFRSARRFPAVVWRHKGNGAVISRCSQPEVGWFGWRSNEDEELVQNIVLACADNGRVTVPDTTLSNCKNEQKTISSNSSEYSGGSGGELYHNGGSDGGGGGPPPSPGGCNSLSSMEVVPEPPSIKKLLILDARSYSTAVVNRARGGGCECLEYYTNCEIQFMNLANIHSIRKSFINVRSLCSLPADQANNNWFSQLESCKWLQHMSGLMRAAVTVGTAIENEARPVMVHCSDGWDRTPQIVALAEILLDPYYRSLEGFQVLVEREWLDFGHKFADRCGQGVGSEDSNERCPVFLQWLDCLHQLINQFPTAFEFNLTFLVKLAQHTYSNLFGTFLCNTAKERHALSVVSSTHSIWRFLRAPANYGQFRNHLYSNCDQVLWPCCEVRELKLWTQVYLGFDNPASVLTEVINPSQESSPAPSVAADFEASERLLSQSKARSSSCENLHPHHPDGVLRRRKSDPSLSDSVLGIDSSEEVESSSLCLPQTEKMLTAASKDIDDHHHYNQTATATTTTNNSESYQNYYDASSSSSLHKKDQDYQNQEMTNFNTSSSSSSARRRHSVSPIPGCFGEEIHSENEEEDEEETNSEEKSTASVVHNLKYLKSIESSTDTLVAELGTVTSDTNNTTNSSTSSSSYSSAVIGNGIQKFVMDIHHKTETRDELEAGVRADILSTTRKTEPENRRFLFETENGGGELDNFRKVRDRESLCDTTSNSKDLFSMLATLPSDLDQLIGIPTLPPPPPPPQQHCEVCATSRKLLQDDVSSSLPQGTNSMMHTSNSSTTTPATAQSTNNITTIATIPSVHHHQQGTIMPLYHLPTSSSYHNNHHHLVGNGISNGMISNSNKYVMTPAAASIIHSPRNPPTTTAGYPFEEAGGGVLVVKHGGDQQRTWRENYDMPSTSSIMMMMKPSFDVDGLEPLHDEVQSRLNVIISGYKGKIDNLQRELQMYRDALKKQVCHQCTHHTHHLVDGRADDAISVADSLCSGEHQSVGHESHSSEISNISWEAVDERDTRPPLWLPDYAVTRCMGCEATFWLGKRKHHCRSCGKIFCADCSEHAITIPSEQLFTPVRVCSTCFYRLSGSNPSCLNGLLTSSTSTTSSSNSSNSTERNSLNGSLTNGSNNHISNNSAAFTTTNKNGLSHRASTSEYMPSTLLDSSSQHQKHHRRMSEELPRKHLNHQAAAAAAGPICNGGGNNMKLKTKVINSSSSSSNDQHQYHNGDQDLKSNNAKTNGHLSSHHHHH